MLIAYLEHYDLDINNRYNILTSKFIIKSGHLKSLHFKILMCEMFSMQI